MPRGARTGRRGGRGGGASTMNPHPRPYMHVVPPPLRRQQLVQVYQVPPPQPQPQFNLFGYGVSIGLGGISVAPIPPTLASSLKAIGPNGEPITFPFPTSVKEFPKYVPTADPPVPPNWDNLCNNTIPTLPFKTVHKFPLAPDSVEYQTLAWMIEPSCNVQITGIEQIVNQDLWEKFLTHRKETMTRKCQDLKILSDFKLPDEQLASITSINLNSALPNFGGNGIEYSDNICLLFHCTRGNIEQIFEEGLDERVGNGGLLGRGIYFADDPLKSMNYDGTGGNLMIFMVYLGDCLATTEIQNVNASTREPQKLKQQMRTSRDRSFDSIAGTPNQIQNEFVIYNRYQCVPVFSVKYVPAQQWNTTSTTNTITQDLFYGIRRTLPDFIWKRKGHGRYAVPGEGITPSPLHAKTIFDLMKSFNNKIQALLNPSSQLVTITENEPERMEADKTSDEETQEKLAIGLSQLIDFGFTDDELNSELLKKHNYKLEAVIKELVDQTTSSLRENKPGPSTSKQSHRGKKLGALGGTRNCLQELNQSNTTDAEAGPITCPICCEDYDNETYMRKLSICNHSVCHNCYKESETSGTTMTGATYISRKCPFCYRTSGIQVGSCPDGQMKSSKVKIKSTPWIKINYEIIYHGLSRVAYLPSTAEGQAVLELLKTAWDRRLIFSLNSGATASTNTVVWNISHKTTTKGGESKHGYPDDNYLSRVKDELKQYGIE